MTNFLFIEQIFPEVRINLRVLSRGTERYRLLMYQHEGVLDLTEKGSKLGNQDAPVEKFKSFFELAKEKNTDLVMTPEYSCPWDNIRGIVQNPELWPNDGKLWVLGAESITPAQIMEFYNQSNNNNVSVYFDRHRLNDNGVFFDPLVYIFKGTQNDEEKLFILIQFKTQHMGVRSGGDLERDRLIEGHEIYIIRNNIDSVNLLTVICSEAMNFPAMMDATQRANTGWNDRPYLILNPQVNPDPLHVDFIAFRKFVFDQERKEIIGLNWNLNSKIVKKNLLREGTSRSGLYLTSHDVNFDDHNRVRKNHRLGLYYFYFGKHKHAFILNSKPHGFLIENLSVHITEGVLPQRMRNGPELMESYFLQPDNTFARGEVSDDHLECLTALGCVNRFLTNAENCVIEKERLVCLSSGEFLPSTFESWAGLDKLFSIRLAEETEVNKRMTYAEDQSGDSQNQRQRYVAAVNELEGVILPDKSRYPGSIADLKSQPIYLGYAQTTDASHVKFIKREKFRYNLVNEQGEMVNATVCYLGLSDLKRATEAFEFLQSMFESDSMNRRRVVVFYKTGIHHAVKADGQAGRIVIPEETKPSSYLNEQ
jgi:hypothetical protein